MFSNQGTGNRLYLSQGEENIYIDNCNIPQHHIEGIRFIYRQFKRKNSGVIINDHFSFGRSIQIILFLKGIHTLLEKPVLILCAEGSEYDWLDRFYTWSDLEKDVVIELTNPAIKKLIIINASVNLPVFCGREWSIVIIDGDKNQFADQILKCKFKADFKIWNTTVNMRENLEKFAEIYSWMDPNNTFDKHYFIPNPDNAVDVLEKSILLDSFMEDIVIRRDDLNTSFENYQRGKGMPPPPKATPTTSTITTSTSTMTTIVSKKNKDATGTKIKRSKTRTDVTQTSSKPYQPPTATVTKLFGESSKTRETDITEDYSIDNFKRKNCIDNKDLAKSEKEFKMIEISSLDDQSDLNLYYEQDSAAKAPDDKLEEMDTLVFAHDTFIGKLDETGINNNPTCDIKETAKVPMLLAEDKNTIKSSEKINKIDSDNTKMNIDELNKEMSDLDTTDKSEIATDQKNCQSKIDVQSNIQSVESNDELNKEASASRTIDKNTEQANSLKRSNMNIEDKVKEYEERVTKKFKGSFLDSLF